MQKRMDRSAYSIDESKEMEASEERAILPRFTNLNVDNYPQLLHQLKGLTLVRFWAPWSFSCADAKRTISSLLTKRRADFHVVELNIDRNRKIAEAFKVRYLPELLILRDGQEAARIIGEFTEDELECRIDVLLEAAYSHDRAEVEIGGDDPKKTREPVS